MLITFEETTLDNETGETESVETLLSIHYFIAPKIIEDEDFNEERTTKKKMKRTVR